MKDSLTAPALEYRDKIALLTLGDDENRFSPDWLDAVHTHLDEVENDAQALITTGLGSSTRTA
ncbi:MAG: enoyl-CoA hydratase [Mycobacterium sp.]|nr:enoyl-CoA hydratase [Mycobacterium sp.]